MCYNQIASYHKHTKKECVIHTRPSPFSPWGQFNWTQRKGGYHEKMLLLTGWCAAYTRRPAVIITVIRQRHHYEWLADVFLSLPSLSNRLVALLCLFSSLARIVSASPNCKTREKRSNPQKPFLSFSFTHTQT